MCNGFCTEFGDLCLKNDVVFEKDILEVGSFDVNGSLRLNTLKLNPKSYTGVDISAGSCVDKVVDANDLVKEFGKESFDVVISTEMMEHIENWRNVINNMKEVLRPLGYILITTRSKGFGYHAYPHDYWRYEESDIRKIFADFEILETKIDGEPGISIFARKPKVWTAIDLSTIELYDIRTELKGEQNA